MSRHAFDVVVVGCGVAGLSAAVAAAEQGARVGVLERAPAEERGGNTRYTEAFLRMKSLDEVTDDFEACFAANAGFYLDPSLIEATAAPYAQWPSIVRALSFPDPELVSGFAAAAGLTLRWLTGLGVHIDFLPTPFLTLAAPRMSPRGGGLALVETLASRAEALGVTFFYETTVVRLIQDDEGAIIGVQAVGASNRRADFYGCGVVLASGGFEGNSEMMARYIGPRAQFLRPVARGGYYNKGEGIRMALEIGAAPCGDFGSYHAEPIDPRSGIAEPAVFIFPHGILVNRQGNRFVDEAPGPADAIYESITRRIFDQTEGIGYVILDAKIEDVPNYKVAIRTDQPPITSETIAGLADKLEIPSDALVATLRAYNAACPSGRFDPNAPDGLSTHGLVPPKSNWARPIDTPPYRAYPIVSANVFTFGGLKVNVRAEVLNNDGEIIPGLYAAGEVVGLYYKTYTGSTSVLKGAVFGRLGGFAAAERARGARVSVAD